MTIAYAIADKPLVYGEADNLTLDDLIEAPGYAYLATVYSRHKYGLGCAFNDARRIASWLIRKRIRVFCPIAHSHPIAAWDTRLSATDHDLWMWVDRPFMDGASALIVAKMDGWQVSRGISEEIEAFEKAGKPIIYLDPKEAGL